MYRGYALDSIAHFVANVAHLKAGGSLGSLSGTYPDASDGVAATKVAAAVHESLDRYGTPITCT